MTFNVGVTGHRQLSAASRPAVTAAVARVLALVKEAISKTKEKPDLGLAPFSADELVRLRVLSPLAAGADQIVAEAGLDLGYTLQCALPFERVQYTASFRDGHEAALESYWRLLDRAESVLEIDGNYDIARESAYQAVGRVVLTYSDILIAIWDGQREKGDGGTAQVVRQAYAQGISIVWINPTRENEVGWYDGYDEEGGQALCRPIREFSGLHDAQSLGDVIDRVYAPPRLATSEGHVPPETSPEESVRTYFQECRVKLQSKIARRCFGRLWPWFYRILSPSAGLAEYHAPTGPVAEYYQAADDLARHYGNMYRSSFLANYVLASLAVFVAMLGPLLQQVPLLQRLFGPGSEWQEWTVWSCTVIELLLLWAIYENYRRWRIHRWHDKFTNYRMLAEQLRHLEFVVPLGVVPSARAFGHDPDDPSEHWTTWHVRNVIRSVGILPGNLNDGNYRGAIREAMRDKWIKEQRDYHYGNAERCKKLEHKLHGVVIFLFVITCAACLLHLFGAVVPLLRPSCPCFRPFVGRRY